MTAICSFIKDGSEFSLKPYTKGHGYCDKSGYRFEVEAEGVRIERRPLNPKTGKPWQKSHVHAEFLGPRAKFQGLHAMLKIRNAK